MAGPKERAVAVAGAVPSTADVDGTGTASLPSGAGTTATATAIKQQYKHHGLKQKRHPSDCVVSRSSLRSSLRGLAKNRQFVVINHQTNANTAEAASDSDFQGGITTENEDALPSDEIEEEPPLLLRHQHQHPNENEYENADLDLENQLDLDGNLAVARPVEEENIFDPATEIPVAEQMDDYNKKAEEKAANRRSQTKKWLFLSFLCLLAVMLTVILIIIFLVVLDDESVRATPAPTNFTTPAHTPISTADYVMSLLPDFTIESIQKSDLIVDKTPQRKAYEWLLEHPHLRNYSDAKILRRYALACLYYSTNGEQWSFYTNHWMNVSAHEFTWDTLSYSESMQNITANWTDEDMDEYYETMGYHQLLLDHNNMIGTIPPELFVGLPKLRYINFASNQLTGTISSMIGTLRDLNCKSSKCVLSL